MWRLSGILGFFVRAALIYAVLLLPWLHGADAYRFAVRSVCNVLMHRIAGGQASVGLKPLNDSNYAVDTAVRFENYRTGAGGNATWKLSELGYRPTAFLMALVVATPLPWRRRGAALLWGLLWVSGFVALRIGIKVLDALSEPNELAIYELGRFWKPSLKVALNVLVRSAASWYIVPALIWMLVSFRREDRLGLMAKWSTRNRQERTSAPRG